MPFGFGKFAQQLIEGSQVKGILIGAGGMGFNKIKPLQIGKQKGLPFIIANQPYFEPILIQLQRFCQRIAGTQRFKWKDNKNR